MVTGLAHEPVFWLKREIAIVYAAERSMPKAAKKHAENAGKNFYK